MANTRDRFFQGVSQIIHQELDSIQHDQYAIEGEEIINSLFTKNSIPDYSEEDNLAFDFGFAPTALEIKAAGITFLDVINGCFAIVKAQRESKDAAPIAGVPDWKLILTKDQTHPVLIDLLCEKYDTVLSEIINHHE